MPPIDSAAAGALMGALALHKIRTVVEDGVRTGHTDVQAAGFGMLVLERFVEPGSIPPGMLERGQKLCEEIARDFRAGCAVTPAQWKASKGDDDADSGV